MILSNWRPIKTAPRGVRLLLYYPEPTNAPNVVIGYAGEHNGHRRPNATHWMPVPDRPLPERFINHEGAAMEQAAMQQYLGVRAVHAEPMTRVQYRINENIIADSVQDEHGYYVTFNDGGTAWISKELFESEFQPATGLTFGLALEALKRGMKVRRALWGECEGYIFLGPSGMVILARDNIKSDVQPPNWYSNDDDLLAEDWELVD